VLALNLDFWKKFLVDEDSSWASMCLAIVNAGPKRREIITRKTLDQILGWLSKTDINTVDLTGGGPEMMPDFRYLFRQLRKMPQVETIIDRCNLTILSMAESPPVLEGYMSLSSALSKGSLGMTSPQHWQVSAF